MTFYQARIRADNTRGNGIWSGWAGFTTLEAPVDSEPEGDIAGGDGEIVIYGMPDPTVLTGIGDNGQIEIEG